MSSGVASSPLRDLHPGSAATSESPQQASTTTKPRSPSASSPQREVLAPLSPTSEAPLSDDLFEYIVSRWLLTEELVIHRKYGKLTLPWMSLILHTPQHNPYWSIFCVSQASCPFPRLPAMITKLSPGQLVLKGQMIYETPEKPEDFLLTFTINPSREDTVIWWNGLLQVIGYPSVPLYILYKGNSQPERGFASFNFQDKRLKVNDPVLYQSINGLSAVGTFQAWKSVPGTTKKQMKITIGQRDYSPSVDLCSRVLASKPKKRALPAKSDAIPFHLDLESDDAPAESPNEDATAPLADSEEGQVPDTAPPIDLPITIEETEEILYRKLDQEPQELPLSPLQSVGV